MDRNLKAEGKGDSRGAASCYLSLLISAFCLLPSAFSSAACAVDERREVPGGAQATVDRVAEEIATGQDQKVYEEAADEWREKVTPAQNKALLGRVRERLGRVQSRALNSGKERDGGAGDLPGHSLVLTYQTTFERGTGMETFTLLERGGHWLLAGYKVTSDALQ